MINNIEFSRRIIINNSKIYCDCGYKHYQELVDKVLKDYSNKPDINLTIQTKIYNPQTFDILGYININFIGLDKLRKIHPFISFGSYGAIQTGFFDGFGFYYDFNEKDRLRIEILMGKVYVNNIELGNILNLNEINPIVDCDLTYQYYLNNFKREDEFPIYITKKNLIFTLNLLSHELNFNILDIVPEL